MTFTTWLAWLLIVMSIPGFVLSLFFGWVIWQWIQIFWIGKR